MFSSQLDKLITGKIYIIKIGAPHTYRYKYKAIPEKTNEQ